jgi:hypothetical protein
MTTGQLILISFGVIPLIAFSFWLAFCIAIARAHPKQAARIIEASRWYPHRHIRPPNRDKL